MSKQQTYEQESDLRVRLDPGLKSRLMARFDATSTSQIRGVNALVAWFVAQDELVQAQVLGQVPEAFEGEIVSRLVASLLVRLEGTGGRAQAVDMWNRLKTQADQRKSAKRPRRTGAGG